MVNPCAMTFNVYFPAGRLLNSYKPWALVCVVRGEPAGGVTTTFAFVMAAPEGSVTWPRRTTDLSLSCALKALVNNQAKQKMTTTGQHFLRLQHFIRSFHSADRIGQHTRTVAQLKL